MHIVISPLQVPAEHLLCASVMNAPAALAVSKLFFPETEQTRITNHVMLHKRLRFVQTCNLTCAVLNTRVFAVRSETCWKH